VNSAAGAEALDSGGPKKRSEARKEAGKALMKKEDMDTVNEKLIKSTTAKRRKRGGRTARGDSEIKGISIWQNGRGRAATKKRE